MQGGESVEKRVPFVGRTDERQRIDRALRGGEALALIGPGGAGKSRLAYESALRWEELGGRAAFISLVGASSGAIAAHVAGALGIRAGSDLGAIESLRVATFPYDLVVLDNAEIAPGEVAAVIAALGAEQGLAILATSRVAIAEVATLPIGPLSVPDATAFFIGRARAAETVIDDDPAALAQVERIVRGLDGLPIAIDLAAARLASLSVAELAEEIEHPRAHTFRARSGRDPRHWSLKRVLDWSLDRMDATTQEIFVLGARFANVFTVEDVAAIADRELPELAKRAEQLAENSLLVPIPSMQGYRILAPIRVAALRRLIRTRNRRALDLRFAARINELARDLVTRVQASGGYDHVDAISRRYGDFVDVLDWALEIPAERMGANIAVPALLAFFWANGGSLEEGMRWCARIAACAEEIDVAARARAYYLCMLVALPSCAYAMMVELAPRAIALYSVQNDRLGLARAYNAYGIALLHTGQVTEALAHTENALRIYQSVKLPRGIATALINQGSIYLDGLNDPARAKDCFLRGVEQLADLADTDPTAAIALGNLAEVAYVERDEAALEANARRALAIFLERGDEVRAAWQHSLLARGALLRDDRASAVDHLEAALQVLHRQPHREYSANCVEVAAALLAERAPFQAALMILGVERIRRDWRLQDAIPAQRDRRALLETLFAGLGEGARERAQRGAESIDFAGLTRMARTAILRGVPDT